MDEFSIIDKLVSALSSDSALVGNGDDAAVISTGDSDLAISVDSFIEQSHFDLSYFPVSNLGAKIVEAACSDLVAMAAHPKFVLVSVASPKSKLKHLETLYGGVRDSLDRLGAQLVGGDLVKASEELSITVVALGLKSKQSSLCERSGARPGDLVYISGPLGASEAGRFCLANALDGYDQLKARHLNPRCRLDLVDFLAENAHAAIDVSDGLVSELKHLSNRSSVAIKVDLGKLPKLDQLKDFLLTQKFSPHDFVANGGEEFEILYTLSPELKSKAIGVEIGEVTVGQGVSLTENGLPVQVCASGWNHFTS